MYDKKNFPPPHTKKNPPKNKIAPNNVVKKEKEYEKKIQNNQRNSEVQSFLTSRMVMKETNQKQKTKITGL